MSANFVSELERWSKDRSLDMRSLQSCCANKPTTRTPEETCKLLCNYYAKQFKEGKISEENYKDKCTNLIAIKQNAKRFLKSWAGIVCAAMAELQRAWTDPQDYSRIIYPMHIILIVVFLGSMVGKKNCQSIATFYRNYKDVLMFLFPDMPPPEHDLSHDTIRRALSFMKDEDINRFFTEYFP